MHYSCKKSFAYQKTHYICKYYFQYSWALIVTHINTRTIYIIYYII